MKELDASKDNDSAQEQKARPSVDIPNSTSPDDKTTQKTKNLQGLALVVSVLALIVSVASYNAAQRSASAAEKTAEAAQKNVATATAALNATIERDQRDQRAWVGIEKMNLIKREVAEGRVGFTINIQNTGKTPGLRATPRIRYSRTPVKDLGDFDFPPKVIESSVYAPGVASRQLFFFLPEEAFNGQEVDLFYAGKLPVYIYGAIDYEDVFGKKHFTRFCAIYPHYQDRPNDSLRLCQEEGYNHME